MLEAMVSALVEERGLPMTVSSGGFLFDGEPASPTAGEVMAERGFDISGHRSRIVSEEMVAQSDLILTMERAHARKLVVLRPEATARIHTAAGFAASVSGLVPPPGPHESPHGIVDRVAELRSSSRLLGSGNDDIADPHGRPRRVHRDTADRLQVITDELVAGLFPV